MSNVNNDNKVTLHYKAMKIATSSRICFIVHCVYYFKFELVSDCSKCYKLLEVPNYNNNYASKAAVIFNSKFP